MTFDQLDERVQSKLEQLGFDAGCRWVEEFRDERGRDPEPEECDEEASMAAERLGRKVRAVLEQGGVSPDGTLLADVERVLVEQFAEALEL